MRRIYTYQLSKTNWRDNMSMKKQTNFLFMRPKELLLMGPCSGSGALVILINFIKESFILLCKLWTVLSSNKSFIDSSIAANTSQHLLEVVNPSFSLFVKWNWPIIKRRPCSSLISSKLSPKLRRMQKKSYRKIVLISIYELVQWTVYTKVYKQNGIEIGTYLFV